MANSEMSREQLRRRMIRHLDGDPLNNELSNLEIEHESLQKEPIRPLRAEIHWTPRIKPDYPASIKPDEQDGYGNETQQTPDPYGWHDEPDPND